MKLQILIIINTATNYYQHRKNSYLVFWFARYEYEILYLDINGEMNIQAMFLRMLIYRNQNKRFEWHNKYIFKGFSSSYFAWSYVLIDHKQVIITKLFTYFKLFELNRWNAKFWLRNYHTTFCTGNCTGPYCFVRFKTI